MDDAWEEFEKRKRELTTRHNHTLKSLKLRQLLNSVKSIRGLTRREPCPTIPLHQLLCIHCPSLAPGTVHSGRFIRGTLVVDPYVVDTAQTIIQDEIGGVARVSLNKFATDGVNKAQHQAVANSLFKRGKKLAIIEPYYKHTADGGPVIRVDNCSQDLVFLEQLGPGFSEGWHNEAEALFTYEYYSEAIYSFTRSIESHAESQLAATLLSNTATSLLLKEHLISSLLFAVASFLIDSSMFRPYYTAGFILRKLERFDLVFNCVEQCRKLHAPTKLYQQLEAGLQDQQRKHISAAKWNTDVLSILDANNVDDLLDIDSDAPINSMSLKERGNELFKNKKYDECIKEYCMALRGITGLSILVNDRAICYARLGKYAEAALQATTSVLITPRLPNSYYWKARSLLRPRTRGSHVK